MRHQRPDLSGHLVGEGYNCNVVGSSASQLSQPSALCLRAHATQYTARPVDQQRAQINITALADAKQLHPSTRAALPRHQAQIGGELPSRLEGPRITDSRYCRSGRQQSNAGDCADPLALDLLALLGGDLPLDISHLRAKQLDALDLPLQFGPQHTRNRG